MDAIVAALTAWLSVATGMPAAVEPPAISFIPGEQIAALHYGRSLAAPNNDIIAAYDPATATVMLREDWNDQDIVDLSVLAHELVHHMQHASAAKYPCPEAREAQAFAAQETYLGQFHENLESAFGIDKLSMMLKTTCLPY
jgi:hypothetical protein